MKILLVIVLPMVFVSCVATYPTSKIEVSQELLNDITRKGHYIYQYDIACWIASDSVMTKEFNQELLGSFMADTTQLGWEVVFGKLNSNQEYEVAFLVTIDTNFGVTETIQFDPPEIINTKWSDFGRAVNTSLDAFQLQQKSIPYNYTVFRDTSNTISVYIMPAQTQTDIYLLGGDKHYLTTSNGSTILNERQLHRSILEFPHATEPGSRTVSTAFTSTPTETDIFHVLRQDPRPTHLVITQQYIYVIDFNGLIQQESR